MLSDTQNGFAFLEALTSDICVESLGRNFDGISAHTGMKVRPSNSGNMPSTLQLLPGQSFYIGKTTLSLVPEEHGDLPTDSSGPPASNFENYNHQVSQISTPQCTARVGSAVMETPMPHRDHEYESLTPILEKVIEQAISGWEDSEIWPESSLKREVMRTVRDTSERGHSIPQPEFRNEVEHMADAAINERNCSSSQLEVKTEDMDSNATVARPLGQGVVDLEDAEVEGVERELECIKDSEPSLPMKSRVHPKEELGGSGFSPIEEPETFLPPVMWVRPAEKPEESRNSPVLAEPKPLSPSVARGYPETRPEASDQSPILQAVSHSSSQMEDDLDDTPVRKKAKTATVSRESLIEESQDSLQDEVISVRRGLPAQKDGPVSADQALSKPSPPSITTKPRPRSVNQPKQRSYTSSTASKHLSPAVESDLRSHPTNQSPPGSSFKSTGPNSRTLLSDRNTNSASPSNSVEPNSSMRSTRSTARDEHNSSSSMDGGIRMLFASSSSAGDSKPFLKFLSNKGVKKVQSVHDCTVLCVGKELKKTSKFILAVLLSKDIVTDSWVTDSVKGNDLLDFLPYAARDPKKEADWGISLDKAINRGKEGFKVLQDQTILFMPSAKKDLGKNGFDELKEVAKCAGARDVVSSALPKKSPKETSSTLVIATQDNTEVAQLQKLGLRAYVKDIISLSVLRGKLDLESDEFLIEEQKTESRKRKR